MANPNNNNAKKPSTPTKGGKSTSSATAAVLARGNRSREDISFAVTLALIASSILFAYLAFGIWSSFQGPKIDPKLSKAQQQALLNKWEPFTLHAFFDGQLGASLFAIAIASFLAINWARDKARVLLAVSAFFLLHSLLSPSWWLPVATVVGGVWVYLALIYSASDISRFDVVEQIYTITPRTLFIVDASLLIYGELLRLQHPDIPVGLDVLPAAVNPSLHRAAHGAIVLLLVLVILGKDMHAYRAMLKVGAWIWFAALCPLLGVYEGSGSKTVLVIIAGGLFVAHVAVHLMFPFNMHIVKFFRKWRSDMKRVVAGAGDE